MTNGLIFLLIVLNLFLMGSLFMMQRSMNGETPTGPPGGRSGQSDMFLKRELNLTTEQFEQIRAIRQAHREEQRTLHQELRKNRDTLIEIMTTDREGANQLADAIAGMEAKLARNLIQHYADLEAVCSPEQATKLAKIFRKALGPPPPRPGGPPPRRE